MSEDVGLWPDVSCDIMSKIWGDILILKVQETPVHLYVNIKHGRLELPPQVTMIQ